MWQRCRVRMGSGVPFRRRLQTSSRGYLLGQAVLIVRAPEYRVDVSRSGRSLRRPSAAWTPLGLVRTPFAAGERGSREREVTCSGRLRVRRVERLDVDPASVGFVTSRRRGFRCSLRFGAAAADLLREVGRREAVTVGVLRPEFPTRSEVSLRSPAGCRRLAAAVILCSGAERQGRRTGGCLHPAVERVTGIPRG